jgi:prevent-host-death family protein
MAKKTYGAEEARAVLPYLLKRARRGEASIITKHGKPCAQVVPIGTDQLGKGRLPFLSLAGSGHGLWGRDSRKAVKSLRDEWR